MSVGDLVACHDATDDFEATRVGAIIQAKRHARKTATIRGTGQWACDRCDRVRDSRIGLYAHCSQKISSMRRSVVYDGSLQARQAVDQRRHSLGVDSRETTSLPVCHATTRQDVGYLLATARVHAIVLICRSVAQPGWEAGGHAPHEIVFTRKFLAAPLS